jgi:putative nucleotidyltransferase with HDIG domain
MGWYFTRMKINKSAPGYHGAISIIKQLVQQGYEALFAGGIVRDMIMERADSSDIDIATNARPETVMRLFPRTVAVGAQFGVVVVMVDELSFEVATFRSDGVTCDGRHPGKVVYTDARNDALRRDFTVNGMFYDPMEESVIDYVGGQEDISRGIIRAIGNPDMRFREDYLRMLRALRFAARFNFTIEQKTWNAITTNAERIVNISVERIFSEVDKMLCSENPEKALDLLGRSGLLNIILPEVSALKGVNQPPQFHPEGDVFEHTRLALKLMPPKPSSVLAWSTLLHDIGKPATMVHGKDRVRFNNHDQAGVRIAADLLKKFRTSNTFMEDVCACIGNHMNFMHVRNMKLGTLKKFLSRPTIETELELHRIDCMASHGDCENLEFLRKSRDKINEEALKPEPLLRGRDLLKLGFKPGPRFGEILSTVYDAQLDEEISSYDEAVILVEQKYPDRQGR